ncbi:MAG: hypothetical protein RQ833_11680 [Sphingomonadaceae bacterium]|nr:hypothetical protein [Sphingomonadaceae bacterium]
MQPVSDRAAARVIARWACDGEGLPIDALVSPQLYGRHAYTARGAFLACARAAGVSADELMVLTATGPKGLRRIWAEHQAAFLADEGYRDACLDVAERWRDAFDSGPDAVSLRAIEREAMRPVPGGLRSSPPPPVAAMRTLPLEGVR